MSSWAKGAEGIDFARRVEISRVRMCVCGGARVAMGAMGFGRVTRCPGELWTRGPDNGGTTDFVFFFSRCFPNVFGLKT